MANPIHATSKFNAPIILTVFLFSMIPLNQVTADRDKIPRINKEPLNMRIGATYNKMCAEVNVEVNQEEFPETMI